MATQLGIGRLRALGPLIEGSIPSLATRRTSLAVQRKMFIGRTSPLKGDFAGSIPVFQTTLLAAFLHLIWSGQTKVGQGFRTPGQALGSEPSLHRQSC